MGGSGLRRLELAGWGGLKQLEQAGQELSGGHWGYEFCSRKFGFLCTESRNNLEFVNVWGRKMNSVCVSFQWLFFSIFSRTSPGSWIAQPEDTVESC